MPAPYGLTTEGFSAPTFQELRDAINARIWATISPTLDLSDRSYEGQVVAIVCEQVVLAWEMGEDAQNVLNPDDAVDAALDAVCLLTGTLRRGASASTATLTFTGDDATVIPPGTIGRVPDGPQFATDDTDEAVVLAALTAWAPLSAYALNSRVTNGGNAYVAITSGVSAGADGPTTDSDDITDGTVHWRYLGEGVAAVDAAATATTTGPLAANSGTITEIGTPLGGLLGVINLLDANAGTNQMSNEELRVLRELELARRGTGPIDAIEADLIEVAGVAAVTVFNNNTDVTDDDGVPPHSVEVLIMGGEDQDIWNQLHRSVGGGIRTHGTEVGTALDRRGRAHTYRFSRPDEIEIYIELTVERDPTSAPADLETQIKDAIVALGGTASNGKNAVASRIAAAAFVDDSVLDVEALIGTAPGPSSNATIAISARELAAYDTSRINITFIDGEP